MVIMTEAGIPNACQFSPQQLDAQLVEASRIEAPLRLQLGQLLEVIGRGPCFELGFSSLTAYVLERCERGVRWALAARSLARRLEALPKLREAVASGEISWSKAELIGPVAEPSDEARWVQTARQLTVRQLRKLLQEQRADEGDASLEAEDGCTLVCTVDREEAWLFEATGALLTQLGTQGADAQLEALLAEAQVTLLDGAPPGAVDLEAELRVNAVRARREEQLACWREAVETCCEASMRDGGRASTSRPRAKPRGSDPTTEAVRVASLGCAPLEHHTAAQLDALARNLARALAEHEYRLSCLVLASHRSDTWRHLGYATEAHYARERLGMSRSSFMARCALAAKLVIPSGSSASSGAGLPHIAEALANAKIGVEAAQQLARVATPSTELAWLERARHRTIKHLREEVVAALTARRISGERDCPPPAVREIEAFHELERAACSGRIWRTSSARTNGDAVEEKPGSDSTVEARGAWRVMLTSLREWLRRGIQTSAVEPSTPPCSAGRVTLRLRVSRATHGWWRSLESQARRWLPRGMSWLRFCCLSLWRAWRHLLDPNVAYGHIYIRDRYRCTSPVCNRKDVTPHHLRFRSHGGSDGDENVASVCTWCHLLGIHAGRIRAVGVASHIHWEIGPKNQPCVVVNGRKRESQ